jgi:hypothetical protein
MVFGGIHDPAGACDDRRMNQLQQQSAVWVELLIVLRIIMDRF